MNEREGERKRRKKSLKGREEKIRDKAVEQK